MAHFIFVISQNAKWGHAGFYIDCHRMTVPENIFFTKKALFLTIMRSTNPRTHSLSSLSRILKKLARVDRRKCR